MNLVCIRARQLYLSAQEIDAPLPLILGAIFRSHLFSIYGGLTRLPRRMEKRPTSRIGPSEQQSVENEEFKEQMVIEEAWLGEWKKYGIGVRSEILRQAGEGRLIWLLLPHDEMKMENREMIFGFDIGSEGKVQGARAGYSQTCSTLLLFRH